MKAIISKYEIGLVTPSLKPEVLAEKITDSLNNSEMRKTWKKNLEIAAKELTWENEEKVLYEIYSGFLNV